MAESFLVDRLGQPIQLPISDRNGSANGHTSGAKLFNVSQDTPYRRWRPQLLNDIARHLPDHHFRAVLSDSRYIYASGGGMVAGAVHKKADYTIGDAWTPQYTGADPAWRRIAEPTVWGMCRGIDIRGLPYSWNRCAWLSSVCLDRDGDVFIVLTTDPDDGQPKLQFLEAHRIGTPPKGMNTSTVQAEGGQYAGRKILNGVVYDQYDRVIAFNLLPQVTNSAAKLEYTFLPAASVIHIFDPRWFSQGRGTPSVSYGILDWYDISEIRDAEKIAVKVNSSDALIEKNETGIGVPPRRVSRADPPPGTLARLNRKSNSSRMASFDTSKRMDPSSRIDPIVPRKPGRGSWITSRAEASPAWTGRSKSPGICQPWAARPFERS